MIVYAVVDDSLSATSPPGDSIDVLCVKMPNASSSRSTATTRSLRRTSRGRREAAER